MAHEIDPRGPCIVGGASFGGAVALEMATHLQAQACVLIGSIRTPNELRWQWQCLRRLGIASPNRLQRWASGLGVAGNRLFSRRVRRGLERLARPDETFYRWAACALLNWKPSARTCDVRVFQIHGAADRTLPVGRTRPDRIVPGGHHALTLFNAGAVNAYLREVIAQVVESSGEAIVSQPRSGDTCEPTA
jgi:thioesterase domain-containing protein